jgi:hypothetical protein
MSLFIKSRHTRPESLQKSYGDGVVIDVTSRASEPWVRFSPFYPHGGIPVPFSPGEFSMTVEGIWQGLKVFETTSLLSERDNQKVEKDQIIPMEHKHETDS